ncbi:MAG: type IV pilus assembly protein PilM [Terrimicrobiaceae bacterium]|nr:type IV pilus assembly protein PilM [Terrimicrobiaceae bacterium]
MSAPTRIRVLNLGMQNVALAEFHTTPAGALTLSRLDFSELLADPGADASRPGQLEAAIAQLKAQTKIPNSPVNYALPSQSVFTRYLSLPGSTAEDLNQIIAFEAQQNIPFPIDEVVWDYQPLGEARDGKLNVVLLAIKTDLLEAINRAVETAGFEPRKIDVAPLALLNAFRYNYADLDGCSLLVDVGSRTTNLIFIEGDKAYTRSIPVGGNAITVAIAKEFGQPVEAAELAKKEKGFVGLGGSYAEHEDELASRISKLARTTLTRLHAEIVRSISFYRANQGGTQPLRVFLAGGAVSMPYMLEFFGEKLQMPVEFFNPFRNVAIASTVDTQILSANAHAAGEIVGLALRELGNCPIEINLRPPAVVNAQTLARRKPFLIAATVCLFLALIQGWIYFSKASAVQSVVLEGVNRDIAALDSKAQEFDRLKKAQDQLEAVATPLLTSALERDIWVRIIDELGAKLPPQFIWITRLTPMSNGRSLSLLDTKQGQAPPPPPAAPTRQRPGTAPVKPAIDAIEIQGLYFYNPSQAKVIDDFVNNLQGSPLFSIAPNDKAKVVTRRNTPDDESWAYAYTIVLPLKNPIALP